MSGRLERLAQRLVNDRSGRATLAFASFLESTVVPIPLETVAAPLMAAHPGRAWAVALWIWLGCLVGAALFYALGLALFEPVAAPVIEALGLGEAFEAARDRLDREGLFWAVFVVSLSPAPFQLATLGAGAAGGSPLVFLAAVAASRAVRYFGLAFLAARLGPRALRAAGSRRALILGGGAALLGLWAVWTLAL